MFNIKAKNVSGFVHISSIPPSRHSTPHAINKDVESKNFDIFVFTPFEIGPNKVCTSIIRIIIHVCYRLVD